MLALGHAGLTLGAAARLNETFRRRRVKDGQVSWAVSLGKWVDIRLLMAGSLLPDIIDKPVGQVFFRETFSDGRIFAHTLLFLVLLGMAGYWLYRRRAQSWLLVLAGGTLTHFIFDQMWRTPGTLLWPLLGGFERIDLSRWLPGMVEALFSNPEVYVPEILGGFILAWFGLVILRRRKVAAFLRYGRVE